MRYLETFIQNTHISLSSLATFLVMLLSLINLSSTTAFSIIISISTFGLYQSYIVAIACILHARLSGRMDKVSSTLDVQQRLLC